MINKPFGLIYVTTNTLNGKKYIGQTTKPEHKVYLGSGKALKRALAKYGLEKFTREVIAYAYSREELNALETKFIAEFNAHEDLNWYNISSKPNKTDGFKGLKHSPETREKMRQNMLTNHPNKGKHFSEETCKRMSESKKGHTNTSEKSINRTRQMGLANKGSKRTEETKIKMSLARKGKPLTEKMLEAARLRGIARKGKPTGIELNGKGIIWAINTPTGIVTTKNLDQWSKEHNINGGALYYTLKSKKPHAKSGYQLMKRT